MLSLSLVGDLEMKRQPFYLFLVQAIREQLNERMGDDHAGEQSTSTIIIIILGMNERQLFRGGTYIYLHKMSQRKSMVEMDPRGYLPTLLPTSSSSSSSSTYGSTTYRY